MRILHLADVHLDRPFVGLPLDVAKRRRGELFEAFRRCIELGEARQANLITVGGDLWEEEHVSADTRNSVAHELGRLAVPVLLICGNHDPLLPGGSYMRTEWPSNVYIFPRRTVTERRFDGVSVWGISWGGGDLPSNVLDQIAIPDDGRAHLLLLHGTAVPLLDLVDEAYFPFQPWKIQEAGLTTCLAGHVHIAQEVPGVIYPGSPEPLGWGDQGRHCAALIDINDGALSVELLDVNLTRYETREVNCTGCGSSAEIRRRVNDAIADNDPSVLYLRIRLVGEVGPDCEVDAAQVERKVGGGYGALVVEDRTEPLLDIESRADRKGLEGLFVRTLLDRLQETQAESERRRFELALNAGLRAIDGKDPILHVD
jgi:exonuclease SbcD